MQKSTSQKIRLGIFVVFGTILLISALYFVGNSQNMFRNNITLKSYFNNVNGLKLGNNVRYSGINTGTVSKIEMTGESQILVEMLIEKKLGDKIKTNAVATIGSDGLVGSMIVNIIPQQGDFPHVKSGDTIQSYSKIGADDMLSTLSVTNENAAILTSDLLKITTRILEGKGTVGMLINDSIMAQDLKNTVFKLNQASTNASQAIKDFGAIIAQVNFSESVAGVLLSDTIAAKKMRNVVDNLDQSSADINSMTVNMDAFLKEIIEGDGAVNYITTDQNFVRDLDSTMTNIKEATFKLNENMEALKSNFFFRGYFKKIEKEQMKEAKKNKN